MTSTLWPLLLCAISVFLLVTAETTGRRWAIWIFKPAASCCFLWLAWVNGAADSSYGSWLLAGLAACWFGDVLLIPKRDITFLAGLASFLLGHLLFAVAFLQLDLNPMQILVFALPALVLGVFAWRWMNPHLPGDMRVPVLCYLLVICTMLACAGNSLGQGAAPWIIAGAWGFAISDLAVARDQFIKPAALNRIWGLPLYFGSQLTLAWSPLLVG